MQRQDNQEMIMIINNLRSGNLEYFDLFYDKTKKQVYFAIISIIKDKHLAEDIMQDTYMRFLDNISKYKDKTNVIAFIVTIARNLAINAYNKRKKEISYDFDQLQDTYQDSTLKETPLLDLVYEVLSKEEAEIFVLHTIDELKHREIAKIINRPLGTVTWVYNKAVKKLKERINSYE